VADSWSSPAAPPTGMCTRLRNAWSKDQAGGFRPHGVEDKRTAIGSHRSDDMIVHVCCRGASSTDSRNYGHDGNEARRARVRIAHRAHEMRLIAAGTRLPDWSMADFANIKSACAPLILELVEILLRPARRENPQRAIVRKARHARELGRDDYVCSRGGGQGHDHERLSECWPSA